MTFNRNEVLDTRVTADEAVKWLTTHVVWPEARFTETQNENPALSAYLADLHTVLERILGNDGYDELAPVILDDYEDDDDEDENPFEVDGVDIRELVTHELWPDTKNVLALAEHQRSRGDVAVYGPYPTLQDALDEVYQKYRDGDFDVHGCYVDLKVASR